MGWDAGEAGFGYSASFTCRKLPVVTVPTDSLHKCLAMLGLAIIASCFYFWWPLKVEVDNDYAELVVFTEQFQKSYKVMAESTNAAIAMINSVEGDRSKLDDVQMMFIAKKIEESEPASKEAGRLLAETLKPLRVAEVRYKRFVLASWILGAAAFVGLLMTSYGFYRWGQSERKPAL